MPAPCQPQNMNVSLQVETCQPQEIIVSLMSASKLKHVNPRRWLLAPRLKHVSLKTRMSASTDVSDWNGQPHRMIVSLSAGSDWSSHPHKNCQPLVGTDWMCQLQKMSATSWPQIGRCQPQTGIVSLIKKMSASSWSRLKCISLNLNQC